MNTPGDPPRKGNEVPKEKPSHRKWGVFYYCEEDPRVIVPKRLKWMGWTVNVARPSAIPVTLLLIGIVVVPLYVGRALGAGPGAQLITGAVSIAVLCLVCARMSSRAG